SSSIPVDLPFLSWTHLHHYNGWEGGKVREKWFWVKFQEKAADGCGAALAVRQPLSRSKYCPSFLRR
ncbi:MAG: hypothetical protein SOX38_10050, partial [Candidatus Limiplasma sp.]|nr:hypothetical protein [Candidatus Limiplasma sp.]